MSRKVDWKCRKLPTRPNSVGKKRGAEESPHIVIGFARNLQKKKKKSLIVGAWRFSDIILTAPRGLGDRFSRVRRFSLTNNRTDDGL